ncbi:MAG: hypothetical protein HW416_3732 [Chloroflexi bacterium]|nr:hypothetical protein [Chloroflexota bacterium]
MGLHVFSRVDSWIRTPLFHALVALFAGGSTFVVAYATLTVLRSGPASVEQILSTAKVGSPATAPDSLSRRVGPGRVAIAGPSAAQELLLAEVREGDRVDVIAALPANQAGSPSAAVVVRGAVVLGRASSAPNAPLLMEVTPDEAVVLGHLIQRGVRLNYALWSSAR